MRCNRKANCWIFKTIISFSLFTVLSVNVTQYHLLIFFLNSIRLPLYFRKGPSLGYHHTWLFWKCWKPPALMLKSIFASNLKTFTLNISNWTANTWSSNACYFISNSKTSIACFTSFIYIYIYICFFFHLFLTASTQLNEQMMEVSTSPFFSVPLNESMTPVPLLSRPDLEALCETSFTSSQLPKPPLPASVPVSYPISKPLPASFTPAAVSSSTPTLALSTHTTASCCSTQSSSTRSGTRLPVACIKRCSN